MYMLGRFTDWQGYKVYAGPGRSSVYFKTRTTIWARGFVGVARKTFARQKRG